MREFDQQLLRLKQAVRLSEDQDVAELLGMTKAAFSARKVRGAFPADKVKALALDRPELNLDVKYVLTGVSDELDRENQHRVIRGYRELSQDEIDLMNEIKAKGEEFEALLGRIENRLVAQYANAKEHAQAGLPEQIHWLDKAQPGRWLAIARTDIQTGIMAAVRAVAQPTTF